jgi:cell division protein FtsL
MFEKMFYSLWIVYTVVSLSTIGLFVCFALYAKWENAKHRKKIDEMLSRKTDLEDESW